MLICFVSCILGSLFLLPLSSFELFMMSFHLYNSLSFSFYLFYFLVVALVFLSLIDCGPSFNNTTPLHVWCKAGTAGLSTGTAVTIFALSAPQTSSSFAVELLQLLLCLPWRLWCKPGRLFSEFLLRFQLPGVTAHLHQRGLFPHFLTGDEPLPQRQTATARYWC